MAPPLERSIENRVVQWWRLCGNKTKQRKMNGLGNNGWPDRMFLAAHRFVAFIEFKRPGNTTTKLQENTLNELRDLGFPAEVFDNAQEAIDWLATQVFIHTERSRAVEAEKVPAEGAKKAARGTRVRDVPRPRSR